MPTKARKQREATKKLEAAAQEALFSVIPDYLKSPALADSQDLDDLIMGCWRMLKERPWLNLGCGLLQGNEHGEVWPDAAAMARGRTLGNADKQEGRAETAARLKRKYPNRWGRGGAKFIAMSEADGNKKLCVRTVQKLIKDFP